MPELPPDCSALCTGSTGDPPLCPEGVCGRAGRPFRCIMNNIFSASALPVYCICTGKCSVPSKASDQFALTPMRGYNGESRVKSAGGISQHSKLFLERVACIVGELSIQVAGSCRSMRRFSIKAPSLAFRRNSRPRGGVSP